MTMMKEIAIFQRDFRVGGIQKALLNLLERLDYSRVRVDVYVFDDEPFYPLPQREGLRYLCCPPWPFATRFVPFPLLLRFGRIPLEEKTYDVAVDFNSYSSECAVGALRVKARRRVMWVHNDMRVKYQDEKKYRVLWHFFKEKFAHFDAFAAVSEGIIPGFRAMTGLREVPVTAVPNYIDAQAILRRAEEPTDFRASETGYNLCSMGRLVHQKGFDLLLEDFARVHALRPDMHLYLIGDGPEREALQKQRDSLALSECVSFLGNLSNPFPALRQMDGFALTSRYEGQGIVLWEARALGLELFMAKRLEQYNPGLTGYEDIVPPLCAAKRREKQPDLLEDYNRAIDTALEAVLQL